MNLQQKIYKKLLEVPKGQITTYGKLIKSVKLEIDAKQLLAEFF